MSEEVPRVCAQQADVLHKLESCGLSGILSHIAARFDVTPAQIAGRSKKKTIVAARHEMWLCLHRTRGKSTTEIGDLWGMDHTTVCSGIKSAERRRAQREESEAA